VVKDLNAEFLTLTGGTTYSCTPQHVLYYDNGVSGTPAYKMLFAHVTSGTELTACEIDPTVALVPNGVDWPKVTLHSDTAPPCTDALCSAGIGTVPSGGAHYLTVSGSSMTCVAHYSVDAYNVNAALYGVNNDLVAAFGLDGNLVEPSCQEVTCLLRTDDCSLCGSLAGDAQCDCCSGLVCGYQDDNSVNSYDGLAAGLGCYYPTEVQGRRRLDEATPADDGVAYYGDLAEVP